MIEEVQADAVALKFQTTQESRKKKGAKGYLRRERVA